jgi:hypothetical protein
VDNDPVTLALLSGLGVLVAEQLLRRRQERKGHEARTARRLAESRWPRMTRPDPTVVE